MMFSHFMNISSFWSSNQSRFYLHLSLTEHLSWTGPSSSCDLVFFLHHHVISRPDDFLMSFISSTDKLVSCQALIYLFKNRIVQIWSRCLNKSIRCALWLILDQVFSSLLLLCFRGRRWIFQTWIWRWGLLNFNTTCNGTFRSFLPT